MLAWPVSGAGKVESPSSVPARLRRVFRRLQCHIACQMPVVPKLLILVGPHFTPLVQDNVVLYINTKMVPADAVAG